MRITKAKLVKTVYNKSQYQDYNLPEIAIVGRSNAGKSSMINKLCNNGKLARVSSEPGKTRSINFFSINEGLMLVDLPGYGFAKRSAGERNSWQQLVEGYFTVTERLRHLFLLCDIRHDPSVGDLQMVEYLDFYRIPYTLVATKADKLAKSKRKVQAQKVAKVIGTDDVIPFSAVDGFGMEEVLKRIESVLDAETAFYGAKISVDK
ncbi:MAG: YihA family ribosome biogenesis GTP-binding protein [Clostridiales bacterium]|nr:YihA family ribosome biogenesis GTP-binding protein [Clostridiales bacterium]